MRKIMNPWIGKEHYDCFGCCPENPIGLHLEFYEDGAEIISYWKPQEHYQGWVNTMHGGILATIADELAAWVIFRKLQTCGMTTKIDLKYKQPILTSENQLTVRGHIRQQLRQMVFIDVAIENSQGEKCVEGTIVYCAFDQEKAREMGFHGCQLTDEPFLSM